MSLASLTSASLTPALDTDAHISRHARAALLAIGLLGGSAFVLGAFVPYWGAVIAPGTVVIDGNVKKVQHHSGGTISAILVKEGAVVREGDIVARMDATQVKSNLGVVMGDLVTQDARAARLIAERDGLGTITFPPWLVARASTDAAAAIAMDSERRLFENRRNAYEGQRAQLRERIAQSEKEIEGIIQQLGATEKTQVIAQNERTLLDPLIRQGLIQRQRITQLDREIERNKGALGDATARIDQGRTRIREIQVQIAQIDRERLSEVTRDLREAQAKVDDANQRRINAEDLLQKAEVRATASGVVHELAIHTVGGVVTPGEALMTIVPNPDNLVVEIRIAPADKDRVKETMPARVKFTSFNQRITPELNGTVTRMSPKDSLDQRTGATYFTAAITLDPGETAKLKGERLSPGMIADTFVTTDRRTILEFLTKQFFDYLDHVGRGR